MTFGVAELLGSESLLIWIQVLVIKKHKDNEITRCFMELTQWLIEVILVEQWMS